MPQTSPRFFKIALMVLPIGIIIGTIVFMVMYFQDQDRDDRKQQIITSHEVRYKDIDTLVSHLTVDLGARNVDSEKGRLAIETAVSMTDGRLGPQNVGYNVRYGKGTARHERLWKPLWVEVIGQDEPDEIVVVASSLSGPNNVADATRVSTHIMLAAAMAKEKTARTIRFVFLPLAGTDEEKTSIIQANCLKDGETCHAIIGLNTMQVDPATVHDGWTAQNYGSNAAPLWNYLSGQVQRYQPSGDTVPVIWLSHPTFSKQAWQNNRHDRISQAEKIAPQLIDLILKASQ